MRNSNGLLQARARAELERRRRASNLTFRDFIRRVMPRFRFYQHIDKLISVLQRVADGELDRVMVFMPPRHGKSETVSRLFTAYYLYRYPERWVGVNSYADALASTLSRNARDNYVSGGGSLKSDASAMHHWETGKGGGLWAAGVGGPITGKGFHLGVIDDPLKNAEEAASETIREKQRDWYRSTFYTRAEPGAAVVIIQCMTGDTPVLMSDGTERPLRDIKVDDQIATYDNGKLGTSRVLNHRSNGNDCVFTIRTISGVIVHANAKHPFLVEEHGELKWIPVKNLTTAHKIVTVKDRRGSGREKPVQPMGVINQLAPADTAHHITTRRNGQTGIVLRQSIQSPDAMPISSTDTESPAQSTMYCWPRKMANALSASNHLGIMCERIGAGNYALTTATKPTLSGDFCVTIAISPWVMQKQKKLQLQWSNTSDFTTELIESIEPAGIEEVFDLQVERTENFIANGLVSHNTRWHEDDLSGWLLASEGSEDDEPERWHIVCMPALAVDVPVAWPGPCSVEPDGRAPGEALCPERYPLARLRKLARRIGDYFWSALYQQRPTPPEGDMFRRAQFQITDSVPQLVYSLRYWDKAGSVSKSAKKTAGVKLGISADGRVFVVHSVNGKWGTLERREVMLQTAKSDGRGTAIGIEQEPGSSGLDSVADELRMLMGFGAFADAPSGDKDTRLRPFQAQVQAGNVWLVRGEWNEGYIDEMCGLPHGTYRDQADATAGAFNRLVDLVNTRADDVVVVDEDVRISPY